MFSRPRPKDASFPFGPMSVAPFNRALSTVPACAFGFCARNSAAAPETCGVAWLVPARPITIPVFVRQAGINSVLVEQGPRIGAEALPPGALMSTSFTPKFEYDASVEVDVVAETQMTNEDEQYPLYVCFA